MNDRMTTVSPATALAAMKGLGIGSFDLWQAYFLLGGSLSEFDIDAYVHGAAPLPAFDEAVLSHAVWEMYHDGGHQRPY
jgi:hypothetical protein